MLEGLEFVVGDRQALAGKAVIYTTNLSGSANPFNAVNPAVVVAAEPSDLLGILESLVPVPEGFRDMLTANLKQAAEQWARMTFGHQMFSSVKGMMQMIQDRSDLPPELKEALKAEMAEVPDEKFASSFHGACLPLIGFDPEAVEKFSAQCDVARAPDVPSISFAGLVLIGYAQHYVARYLMQSESHLPTQAHRDSQLPHFQDLDRAEFMRLLDAKVSELMYAMETKRNTDQIFADLKALTSGTFMIKDVVSLCKLAETGHPNKVQLMTLYLKRIQYLVEERYELIRELDRQIRELLG